MKQSIKILSFPEEILCKNFDDFFEDNNVLSRMDKYISLRTIIFLAKIGDYLILLINSENWLS